MAYASFFCNLPNKVHEPGMHAKKGHDSPDPSIAPILNESTKRNSKSMNSSHASEWRRFYFRTIATKKHNSPKKLAVWCPYRLIGFTFPAKLTSTVSFENNPIHIHIPGQYWIWGIPVMLTLLASHPTDCSTWSIP